MNFKFIKDILTNPDGLSYSSKRVWGGITLIATIAYGFIYLLTKQDTSVEPMFILAGLVCTLFGLTSVDFKSIINNKIQTGNTDPSKP